MPSVTIDLRSVRFDENLHWVVLPADVPTTEEQKVMILGNLPYLTLVATLLR